MKRDRFEAAMDKRAALESAEASGQIADSFDVRKAIVDRIHSGEITLEQGQAELAQIKRNAKKNGKITRTQAWSRG